MSITYFNHSFSVAQSDGERAKFLANWWRIYADDPYLAPPYYPTLRRELRSTHNGHLARMTSVFIHAEALPQRQESSGSDPWSSSGISSGFLFEQPVAATAALCDPRREDGIAYLALLRCVNHAESLELLLNHLAESLWPTGCRQVIGPIGLSPYLEAGLLEDHWNKLPPLHTPYNPPYMPELVGTTLQTSSGSRLYYLDIPTELPSSPLARAQLSPFEPARLATDLLPLLQVACSPWANFPPPDIEEATFLLRWLGRWPLYGCLAQEAGQPVGFVLLQPDLTPRLRRANGGRHLHWRLWLHWRNRKRVRQGRLLYGGVLAQCQGRGIGHQLLHQALVTGRDLGWQKLSIGPVPEEAPACTFLESRGARPLQTYRLYKRVL